MEADLRLAASGDDEALKRLVAQGRVAVSWMIAHAVRPAGAEARRVIAAVVKGSGGGASALADMAAGSDVRSASHALEVLALTGAPEAGPSVLAALDRPPLQRAAARAAGTLRLGAAAPTLSRLAGATDPALAREAFLALAVVGDESGLELAQARLGSPVLPERKAAIAYLARFPQRTMGLVRGLLTAREEGKVRTGLEILERIGSDEASRLAVPFLSSPMPGARIGALRVLEKRCPPEVRPEFLALRRDPHPLVRAVALGMDPRR